MPENGLIPSSMAPDKILGIFGDAELSARAPRPCFRDTLMISKRYFFETSLCQANYLQAPVALTPLHPPPPSTCPHWSSFLAGPSEKIVLLIVGLSWIESVPKSSIPSSMAPDKILGIFGDAE